MSAVKPDNKKEEPKDIVKKEPEPKEVKKTEPEPKPEEKLTAKDVPAEKTGFVPILKAISRSIPFVHRSISDQDKINFARHLSVAIRSGLPLMQALQLIGKQVPSKFFKKVVTKIIEDVNNGQFFAQALDNFRELFGDLFVSMVRVGESSGNLSQTLLFLSQELKKQREVSHKVRSALIYPAIILIATVGITVFLMVVIFPKIIPVFTSLHVQLPATTSFIIALLAFLTKYGFAVLMVFMVFIFLIRLIINLEKVHYLIDKYMLRVPVVSSAVINLTLTDFTRSLGILLKSGMNIIDALNVAKRTFHSLYYRHHIDEVVQAVQRGESMTRYLEKYPELFPPMFVGMIQIGENTGNLEENLSYLSEYYESEVDDTIKNLTSIVEPVLLLIMGLVVGFVAISIITPIYTITQGLQVK
jgi:type II secretory pathway component PulF